MSLIGAGASGLILGDRSSNGASPTADHRIQDFAGSLLAADAASPITVLSREDPDTWPVAWLTSDGRYCIAQVGRSPVTASYCVEAKDEFPHPARSASLGRLAISGSHDPGTPQTTSSVLVAGFIRGATPGGTVRITVGGHTSTAALVPIGSSATGQLNAYALRVGHNEVPAADALDWGPFSVAFDDASGAVVDDASWP